jgi:hypothetical protein
MPGRSLRPQRRQSNPRALEAAISRDHLAGDVAGAIRAEEGDDAGDLVFQAIAVERDRVVIGGDDLRGMHGDRELGAHLGYDTVSSLVPRKPKATLPRHPPIRSPA